MTRKGYYGEFGGQFVAETLMAPLLELEKAYASHSRDPDFKRRLAHQLATYGGRPTPLYLCERLTKHVGGAKIWLKREDLLHGGAHKLNNVVGQALLAKAMGKRRIVAETGAGQHGVATAMAGAQVGIPVEVYMGRQDAQRQALNVARMRMMGAKVHVVAQGSQTLKDAINEALRDWVADAGNTYYLIGSVVGPHPFPRMVRDLQSVIGREIKTQSRRAGFRPHALVACVGGGSNAAGTFAPWIRDKRVELVGVEAGGSKGRHSASLSRGRPGILHGARSFLLYGQDGQVEPTHSIAAGLDYPGVGPEHSQWKTQGRVRYATVSDVKALAAFDRLARTEGILPALESAHAVAEGARLARGLPKQKNIVVTLSGRGDKDIETVAKLRGWKH